MKPFAFLLILNLALTAVLLLPAPASGTTVTMTLHGSIAQGWLKDTDPTSNPTITVTQGQQVSITVHSDDAPTPHLFYIDTDSSPGLTAGDPQSANVPPDSTIPTFTASTPGTYTYHCAYHSAMQGSWVVQATPSGTPVVSIQTPTPGSTFTGGPPQSVAWTVGGIGSAAYTFWVNMTYLSTTIRLANGTTSASTNSTSFNVPGVNTTGARINVTVVSGGKLGYAEVTFAIDSTYPRVTSQGPLWINPGGLLAVSFIFSEAMKPLTASSVAGVKETIGQTWVKSQLQWFDADRNLTITFAKPLTTTPRSYALFLNTSLVDTSDPGNSIQLTLTYAVVYTPPPPAGFPVAIAIVGGAVAVGAVAAVAFLLVRRRRGT